MTLRFFMTLSYNHFKVIETVNVLTGVNNFNVHPRYTQKIHNSFLELSDRKSKNQIP